MRSKSAGPVLGLGEVDDIRRVSLSWSPQPLHGNNTETRIYSTCHRPNVGQTKLMALGLIGATLLSFRLRPQTFSRTRAAVASQSRPLRFRNYPCFPKIARIPDTGLLKSRDDLFHLRISEVRPGSTEYNTFPQATASTVY
jgi:hypothetical protein